MLSIEQLKADTSENSDWFKKASENDCFVSDLKTSKSGWIYHQNKRILLLTHEHKEDKKADAEKSEKKGTEKISRDLAVKAVQALKAKKVTESGFYLSDHFNLEHFLTSSKF